MVLDPAREAAARAVFEKWELDFAVVGETIPEDRFVVMRGGRVMADLPLGALSGTAPEYDRPWEPTPPPAPAAPLPAIAAMDALRALLVAPSHAAKHWVWEQYDSMVGADTLRGPGGGAGVVRIHGTAKALAFTAHVTPRYVVADPVMGGRQAVAEAFRNLCAAGARPLAATDNLNFGNPEKPRIMGQLVGAIEGIGAACTALDMPIVSGNVSLYNETDGRAILPTPTIGAVGLIEDPAQMPRAAARPGDVALLLGARPDAPGHLARSALALALWGREDGPPPPVDLQAERRHGDFVRAACGPDTAVRDLGDGGLALAAFALAAAGDCGLALEPGDIGALFGEDQGRYLVACDAAGAARLEAAAAQAGIPLARVGRFGGAELRLGDEAGPMADLVALHCTAFAAAIG